MRPLVSHVFPALCWIFVLLSCGNEVGAKKVGTRVVVIGIDGADWKIIEALAAEGDMPNLMGLRKRGTWGPIETLNDPARFPRPNPPGPRPRRTRCSGFFSGRTTATSG